MFEVFYNRKLKISRTVYWVLLLSAKFNRDTQHDGPWKLYLLSCYFGDPFTKFQGAYIMCPDSTCIKNWCFLGGTTHHLERLGRGEPGQPARSRVIHNSTFTRIEIEAQSKKQRNCHEFVPFSQDSPPCHSTDSNDRPKIRPLRSRRSSP